MPLLGQHLTLEQFCTCTRTYRRHADTIDPFPANPAETLPALDALACHLLDPIIDQVGLSRFQLTYGFCSVGLKRWLTRKDPTTGRNYGRVSPSLDQHMAHEVNRYGRYYCPRLGAACDFQVAGMASDALVGWIVAQDLPFDSLYFYGPDRPIHLSYGPQHKRAIWGFSAQGTPVRRGRQGWGNSV